MIETTVRDYLAEQLPVPVFLERRRRRRSATSCWKS